MSDLDLDDNAIGPIAQISPAAPERTASTSLMRHAISGLSGWLADLVLPPVCLACHEPTGDRDGLCPTCWSDVDFLGPPLCDRLGIRLPYGTGETMISAAAAARPPVYHRARAVGHYEGTLRQLVHGFKFRDRHELRKLFGVWMLRAGAAIIADADIVVPVPLTRLRLLGRRFNQAAILAKEISRRSGVPMRTDVLARVRRTSSQVGLTAEQRRLNVRGAFAVPAPGRRHVDGRRVLLVDDVITTGATIEACTRALKQGGALDVDVIAIGLVADPLRITT